MGNYFEIIPSSSLEWNNQFVKWTISRYFKEKGKLADLGCGKGEVVKTFKEKGYDAEGFDLPELDLEKHLKLKSNTYDYVICKFVFEHVSNIMGLMSEINRILKPKGKVIILTDNTPVDFEAFLEDPTHITPFTIKRLKNLGLLNNFKVITVRKWRNIPYVWRYTLGSFDYSFPFSKQIIGVFEKN